jgi:hypothetical protein
MPPPSNRKLLTHSSTLPGRRGGRGRRYRGRRSGEGLWKRCKVVARLSVCRKIKNFARLFFFITADTMGNPYKKEGGFGILDLNCGTIFSIKVES